MLTIVHKKSGYEISILPEVQKPLITLSKRYRAVVIPLYIYPRSDVLAGFSLLHPCSQNPSCLTQYDPITSHLRPSPA